MRRTLHPSFDHVKPPLAGLADQQVHVLRHQDISGQRKVVTGAALVKNLYKAIARTNCSEVRSPSVTTAGDELKVVSSVEPLQRTAFALHRRRCKVKTRTLEEQRVRHPSRFCFPSGAVPE